MPRQLIKMETIGRMTSAVIHDLNNQMTVLLGYSELVLNRLEPDDPARELLTEMRKAASWAAELAQQLLRFVRKQEPKYLLLQLNELIASMSKLLKLVVGERIQLQRALHPHLGLVRADPVQLMQVIMNLAINARDAMPEGGTLSISTSTTPVFLDENDEQDVLSPARPYILLVVSDSGCGMDEATRARLFVEDLYTTKPPGEGSGLGLSIIRDVIHQLGGRIEVKSVLGQGTTFLIYLPQATESIDLTPSPPLPAPHVRKGTETVLIVEDNEGVLSLIRRVLQRDGYTVLEARDSGQALQVAEQCDGTIHLLVSDVVLPLMDGPDLAECLRKQRPELKILFISGYPHPFLSQNGFTEQNAAFLQKPFNNETLASKVRELLEAERRSVHSEVNGEGTRIAE
jgi:CheY-like chemotaxis protein